MSLLIEVKKARKVYPAKRSETVALHEVDFQLEKGKSVAIVGTSGSGKTTLLQLIGGLDVPTSGEVKIAGQDLSALSESDRAAFRARNIGFVFQFFHLLPYINAQENVALPLKISGADSTVAMQKAAQLLKDVGMSDRLTHMPSQLSGGEQQRVAIARALASEPQLLLADEPTGNLDTENAKKIVELFQEIGKRGVSVVLITHDPRVSAEFPMQIEMKAGSIIRS